MEQKDSEKLLKRIQEGTASKEETDLFEQWYLQYEITPKLYSEKELNQIKKEMSVHLPIKQTQKIYPLWSRYIAVAVSIIAILTIGIWFFTGPYHFNTSVTWTTGDILAGKNTATLILPGGKNISLNSNKNGIIINASGLVYSDGSTVITGVKTIDSISKSKVVETASISTPRGGTYQIVLPDQTHVWLNADSKISFPERFTGVTRKISLIGEAYFEVTKDKEHPFVVQTSSQELEVLGTHFNINAYKEEPGIKTTLLEGMVKVSSLTDSSVSQILKPGQQALFTDYGFKISQADLQSAVSWKNGEFIFNDEPLESVLRNVSRWYDVEIIYLGNVPKDFAIGGFVSRSQPISVILETIAKTKKVNFRIENRKIFVSPTKE